MQLKDLNEYMYGKNHGNRWANGGQDIGSDDTDYHKVKVKFLLDGSKANFMKHIKQYKLKAPILEQVMVKLLNNRPAKVELGPQSTDIVNDWLKTNKEHFDSSFAITLPSSFKIAADLSKITQGNIISIHLSLAKAD
jgi:hypothetical protein